MTRRMVGISLILLLGILIQHSLAQQPQNIKHVVIAVEEGSFYGWPANNGIWSWGDEILVGFTKGEYSVKDGHNIGSKHISKLARSTDGGVTWKVFDPEDYVGDGGTKTSLNTAIDFNKPGFAMRVFGDKYHGTADPEAGFFSDLII
jgi:hypothetical protein